MEVFDLQVSDAELGKVLSRFYNMELTVVGCDFEVHSELPTRRLAKAVIYMRTAEGIGSVELLVKEGSRHELAAVSLANKVLPYSSPRVVLYKLFPRGAWIVLENIPTWIDVGGDLRVGETIVDGLYAIHRSFLGRVDVLSANFSIFPTVSVEQMRSNISRTISDIDSLCANDIVTDLFSRWPAVKECISTRLAIPLPDFPMTLLHGSYYPNTVRGFTDSTGLHVVAYDWQYTSIGWPQIDLGLLLDRLDVLARYRGQPKPSSVFCGRYWAQLSADHPQLDFDAFIAVYRFCYIYRALHMIRWWTKGFITHPTREPGRAVLEVEVKLEQILADGKTESSSADTTGGV